MSDYEVVVRRKGMGCLGACGVLLVGFMGCMVGMIRESRNDTAAEHVVQASKSVDVADLEEPAFDFDLIIVSEADEKINDRLDQSCPGKFDPKPILTWGDKEYPVTMHNATESFGDGLTQPMFVTHSTYKSLFAGSTKQDSYGTFYAIFKGPKAFFKFRAWLKKNGYSNADYMLDPDFQHTSNLLCMKGESVISFEAYYTSSGKIYCWNGHDLQIESHGIGSPRSKDHEKAIRQRIENFKKVAR